MKFRNYCLFVMGDTKDVLPEIVKISESKPNILDAKGILIATFSSIAEPQELKDYFISNNRNFVIFDLNPSTSGYHFTKEEINTGLFGFLNYMDEEHLKQRTDELVHEITSSTITKTYINKNNQKTLENQLIEAVENEDYILAAKLRDKIKNNKI